MSSENNEHMVERVARAIIGALDPFGDPASTEEMGPWHDAATAALEASHHAELVMAVRLLWQFHEPGDIPADLEILVPELLTKIGANQ